jgi:protein-S-isoprenylcysteine O-methyltransferase Ste14
VSGSAGEAPDWESHKDNESGAAPAFPYSSSEWSIGEQKANIKFNRCILQVGRIIAEIRHSDGNAAGCSMRMLLDGIRAVIYSAGFIFLWAYAALWVRRYDGALGISLPSWLLIPGIICMAIGAPIALTCIATFVVRGRGTPAPFDAPRQLVAVGIYRWVRNPMYLGAGLVIVGYGFYVRSLSVLLLAAAMWLTVHLFVYFYEEPVLREKFDGSYEEYCRAVSRWMPRPPRTV